MKRFFAFIFTIIMCFNFLTACSMGSGDSLEIESITARLDEETGETIITIRYLDDMEEPLVFVLPKGETGEVGNGIAKIEPVEGEVEGTTDLMIYFTDGREPQKVTVSNGKDGTSIVNIKIVSEEPEGYPIGSKMVVFVDQNDEPVGDPFVIPAGENGSEIIDIQGETQADGSVKVSVTYTGDEVKEFTIPGGRSIEKIESDFSANEYIIIISYTDGSEPTALRFARPTGLLSGAGAPKDEEGIAGDFYIDTENKKIWQKDSSGKWKELIDLKNERETCKVKFVADPDVSLFSGSWEYYIPEGKSFFSEGYNLPIPLHKEGKIFKGWYTTRTPNVTNSAFTDLTPITAPKSAEGVLVLTLYAVWEEV